MFKRAAALQQEVYDLRERVFLRDRKIEHIGEDLKKAQDRNQWLVLQLGIAGLDVVDIPAAPPRYIPAREIPGTAARIEIRKIPSHKR